MKKSEILRSLKDAGFRLKRNGKKHQLYTDGVTTLPVSHGLKTSPRTIKALEVLLKRKTEGVAVDEQPNHDACRRELEKERDELYSMLDENEKLKAAIKPVQLVHEQFRHLDEILSGLDRAENGNRVTYSLWKAVKNLVSSYEAMHCKPAGRI